MHFYSTITIAILLYNITVPVPVPVPNTISIINFAINIICRARKSTGKFLTFNKLVNLKFW